MPDVYPWDHYYEIPSDPPENQVARWHISVRRATTQEQTPQIESCQSCGARCRNGYCPTCAGSY